MNVVSKNVKDISVYRNNPRVNDNAVKYVAESIRQFGFKVPIVIDGSGVIVTGHTRLKAALQLGMNEVPCVIADDLTPEQVKAFRLADNKVAEFATWNDELLALELDGLDFDMSVFGFDFEDLDVKTYDNAGSGTLVDQFLVPPFSVFDSRQGYWQDRKREWLDLGIRSEVGRDDDLLNGGLKRLANAQGSNLSGTSVFDPVLCEVAYRWFNVEGGKIFDPFAGGSVRGIVAEKLGYSYTGIDLRQEQVTANYENAKELGVNPVWHCDDSLNADRYVGDSSADMIFSCPPYADLEVYSDDPRDISNMPYEDFQRVYREIIEIACRKLKENRFAVWVVGDIRDKRGAYRNFVDFTKECFLDNGLILYNDVILLNAVGTGALRAKTVMGNRKVVKVHQNVLVFYKGEPKKIKGEFPKIEVRLENE